MNILRRATVLGLCLLAAPNVLARAVIGPVHLTVNTTNNVDDGTCDGAHCSLVEAIKASNAHACTYGVNTISFNISSRYLLFGKRGMVIKPTAPLPTITRPVFIDGYSQPGSAPNTAAPGQAMDIAPLITISGEAFTAASTTALWIKTTNVVVRGLVFTKFPQWAGLILVDGGGNHLFTGNIFDNTMTGYAVKLRNTSNNLIGGVFPTEGNVMMGNYAAIQLDNSHGNTIQGNFIGLKPDGGPHGNQFGILMSASNNNVIGGGLPSQGNFIGPAGTGIDLNQGATGNVIKGNRIGLTLLGDANIATGVIGLNMDTVDGNTIGGGLPGEGNMIAGFAGLVRLSQANNNTLQGNLLGTDATGTHALEVFGELMSVGKSSHNLIGGPLPGQGNLFGGDSKLDGLSLYQNADNNTVQGNFFGTDITGSYGLTFVHGKMAIYILESTGNLIGGSVAGAGNVISGNVTGVLVEVAHGNTLQGNLIGTDVTGTVAIPNTSFGVYLVQCDHNVVGGAGAAGNLISGNNQGIVLQGPQNSANVIKGNTIGPNKDASAVIAGSRWGIIITGSTGTIIGGTGAGEGNIISGTTDVGIMLGGGSLGTLMQGNFFGTNRGGILPLPNSKHVVSYGSGMSGFVSAKLGGTEAGAGNVIAFNAMEPYIGVAEVLSNSMHDNYTAGVPPGYIAPGNDYGDHDGLTNFPVITSAVVANGVLTVTGSMPENAVAPFRLEFFANHACSITGVGDGETLIGALDPIFADQFDPMQRLKFTGATFPWPAGLTTLTATATNMSTHGTGSFSPCFTVTGTP